MRYVLIDRITGMVPGQYLTAIKNVSVSDDLVTRYGAGVSALPSAMTLEAMAQAAGLLVAATIQCRAQPVLAKIRPFTAYGQARPGDQIVVRADLESLRDEGCGARATAHVDGGLLAEATIYLALVVPPGAEAQAARSRAHLADTFPEWPALAGNPEVVQ